MSYLYDYGEFLLCIAPIFFIIAFIGAVLLWNSLPERESLKMMIRNDIDRRSFLISAGKGLGLMVVVVSHRRFASE